MRHHTDSRRSKTSGQKQTQTILKPRFCPLLCWFLLKIIIVIKHVCVRASVEDDNFETEGGGCVYLTLFI